MSAIRPSSIGEKLLVRSIAVAVVPLLLLAIVVLIGLNRLSSNADRQFDETRAVVESDSLLVTSQEQAQTLQNELDFILDERIKDVKEWARNPDVIDGAIQSGSWAAEEGLPSLDIEAIEARFATNKSPGQAFDAQTYLVDEQLENPFFTEIFITDSNGYNAALTNQTSDFVQSDEEWWTSAWADGIFLENVEFDESSESWALTVAVRIERRGFPVGVMKATLDVEFVTAAIQSRGGGINYSVLLSDGNIIAETTGDTSRYLNPDVVLTEGQQVALDASESGGLITEEFVYGYTTASDEGIAVGDDETASLGWIVVSEQSAESALAPLAGLQQLNDDIKSSGNSLRTTMLIVLVGAVILAAIMARYMSRSITVPLKKLTDAASFSADRGLPDAVKRINLDGADVDAVNIDEVEIETGDELEDLATSFNSVQSTAVRLAGVQAKGRRNTQEMFVNLGRRNQSLLKRQLRFIDELEQNEADPDTLESLFRLDHLATRMRRNAESLLVLAGDRSPRRWAAPVPTRDSVQAALAEVEGYDRVDMTEVDHDLIQGNVVADVAHILAELIENALNFSPPESEVTVAGKSVDDGYLLTITDLGLGMTKDDLDAANDRLSTVHELSEVPSQYLGLFVVGRLADRHDIDINLAGGEKGGIVATINLPSEIIGENQDSDDDISPDDVQDAEAEATALMLQAEEAMAKVAEAREKLAADTDAEDMPKRRKSDHATSDAEEKAEASKAPADKTDSKKTDSKKTDSKKTDASKTDAADSKKADSNKADASKTDADKTDADKTDADKTDTKNNDAVKADAAKEEAVTKEEEAVEIDGFTFARRESKQSDDGADKKARRSTDDEPDLESYGFTRRESKSDDTQKPVPEPVESSKSSSDERSEEETLIDAEGNRNRWSRFQRGKEDAESGIDEESADADSTRSK